MLTLRERAGWHAGIVRGLIAARSRYSRRRDWLALMAAYAAHSVAGLVGQRRVRHHVRAPGDPEPLTIRLGTSDFHAVTELYLTDVYGFAIPALTARRPPIATVLDLGANIGLTVRLWSRLFPGCTIAAVEPDDENLQLCQLNAGPASATLRTVRAFAGGRAREAGIDRSFGAWAYRMTEAKRGQPASETIRVRTVPQILEEAGLSGATVDLLKCDVEGAEAEIFRGGPEWLRRVRAVLAEVHAPYSADALIADVRASGGDWSATTSGASVLLLRLS